MGFFRDVGNAVVGMISAGATSVVRAANYVYQGTKRLIVKGLTVIADRGHEFVDSVKRGWRKIRPHLANVVGPLLEVAVLLTAPFPKINHAFKFVSRVVGAALVFAGTQLAHAVEAAIRWTIDLTTHIVNKYLRPESWHEARKHLENLQEAAKIPELDDDDRRATQAGAMAIEFQLALAEADYAFKNNTVTNFDHFLRLQAAAKLLKMSEEKIAKLMSVEAVSEDDLLVVHLCYELVKDVPDVTPQELLELDRIVETRLGQKLLPFVFEELLVAWNARIDDLGRDWLAADKARSDNIVSYNMLRRKLRWGLTEEQTAEMQAFEAKTPELEKSMEDALNRKLEMEKYVHSAEGFLQFLEQPGDGRQEEDREELAPRVAQVIIDCAQNGKAWAEISREDQQLISRFALIYQKAFEERMMRVRPAPEGEPESPPDEHGASSDKPERPSTAKKKPSAGHQKPVKE